MWSVGIVGIAGGTAARQHLLAVVALTAVFTVLGLEVIPPADAPTEMWASHAAGFLWTAVVWDGRSRPTRSLAGHLVAQLLLFWLVALLFGWALPDALWMGVVNLGVGVLMLVGYARFHRGDGLAPLTAGANLLLLGVGIAGSLLIVLLGGFPNLEIGEVTRLALWWVIRGTVYAYVAGTTFLLIFFGSRASLPPAPRWAAPVLVPMGLACVWVTYLDPELPLTWFLLLPALVAGSVLSPRGAAFYAIYVAMLGALATLFPINQFGYRGFLPGSVIIDLLLTVSTFITIHLAILRLQRLTATDDLEQQRHEAQGQAELLGTVFESMSDGLVVLDASRAVVLHNTAARYIMRRPIPLGEPRDWVARFGLSAADGSPLQPQDLTWGDVGGYHEVLRLDADGTHRLLDVTSWPLSDASGRTVVLFADVTAERERLSELTGFAGVVAHDLRSPLSSLHGWLEMAEDSLDAEDPHRAREFLSRAALSSVRMRQVIEDWLAYTVQRDGVLTTATVPLRAVVDEIVASYGAAAGVAPEFVVEVDDTVTADRVLTTQLLANLIGNAVKYTSPGERPRVTVRSAPDEEPGFVRVEVVDCGIGLPPGEEEQVFEEFHRAAAHAEAYSGTGLGLSLCRRIVHRHGGGITARNNPDGGATFAFTLPAA